MAGGIEPAEERAALLRTMPISVSQAQKVCGKEPLSTFLPPSFLVQLTKRSFSLEGLALALPGLLSARQDPPPLLRLLRPHHDRLRRRDNHLLQRG